MRWVEGRIGHCSRVLRRCHHERYSCSGEFGFRLFIKQSPSAVCVPLVMWKKCVFLRAQFGWRSLNISLSDSVLETKKTLGKVLNSTCRTKFVNYRRRWTLMVLTFLTALVLYSLSDYLNRSNRDSDWLIVACLWEYIASWRHCCPLWK